jgi:hypothetical protein
LKAEFESHSTRTKAAVATGSARTLRAVGDAGKSCALTKGAGSVGRAIADALTNVLAPNPYAFLARTATRYDLDSSSCEIVVTLTLGDTDMLPYAKGATKGTVLITFVKVVLKLTNPAVFMKMLEVGSTDIDS